MKHIKQGFPKREWNEYYSKIDSYYYLGVHNNLAYAAFTVKEMPREGEELTVDELRRYDEYRRRINCRPFPMMSDKDNDPDQMDFRSAEKKAETRSELQKLRKKLGFGLKMDTNLAH